MKLVLGIDTGGTYTDAVLLDAGTGAVVASGKARTTRDDLSRGISDVMDSLPAGLLPQVGSLALSTTLATNACVEDKGGRAKLGSPVLHMEQPFAEGCQRFHRDFPIHPHTSLGRLCSCRKRPEVRPPARR